MNRGEPLTWGITINTTGPYWTVQIAGSQAPDWYFDTWEDLIEWMEDQHEGLKIGRMAK